MNYAQFTEFINSEFKRLEINNYEAYRAERTYFNQDQLEAGACRIHVYFKPVGTSLDDLFFKPSFMCFYPLSFYNLILKKGGKLYIKSSKYIKDFTVEYTP
jgi:hypothetical protein